MNRRLVRMMEERSLSNSMQATRIQQIIADSVDPKNTSDLIFEMLHADRQQRDLNAAIEVEIERSKRPWYERILG